MTTQRSETLATKLEKGRQRTLDIFNSLAHEEWEKTVYREPLWQVRHLLVHFVSAERELLTLAQDIAEGGSGAPTDFNITQFNANEQERLKDESLPVLLGMLDQARTQTILWVKSLTDDQLNRVGMHPVLGRTNVETIIESIYGHQLMHMRDLLREIRSVV